MISTAGSSVLLDASLLIMSSIEQQCISTVARSAALFSCCYGQKVMLDDSLVSHINAMRCF